MKFRIGPLLALGLLFTAPLPAQESIAPEQIDQLLGPVALYPDALIALILPAATQPADVAQAARYLRNGGDPDRTDNQPWDDSLKALVHYPDVVNWMEQNMAWTEELGAAFTEQPADVMNSIQHLRAEARAAGTLVDTPQQQVIVEDNELRIVPVQPDVIYVPYYDPEVVYVSRPGYYSDSYLTFGTGYATGFWLAYDFDWRQRRIWTIDPRNRQRYWNDRRNSRQPGFSVQLNFGNDPNRHQWQPRPAAPRPPRPAFPGNRPRTEIARPAPFPNAPPRPPGSRQNPADRRPDNRNQPSGPNRRPENQPGQPPGRTVTSPQSPPQAVTPPQPVRPAPSPTRPPNQNDRDNNNDRRRGEPDDKPAIAPPPPARIVVPPAPPTPTPTPSPREVRPTPPAVRPPAREDNDNRERKNDSDNEDDRRRRGPDDKPAVAPPPQPVRPPAQPPAPPPKQVRPAQPVRPPAPPPRKDDNDKDDKDDKDDRRRDRPDDRRKN